MSKNKQTLKNKKTNLIFEKAFSPKNATKSGLALFRWKDPQGGVTYALYDAKATIEMLQNEKYINDPDGPDLTHMLEILLDETMVGMVSVNSRIKGSWGASEIQAIAAKKGFGPLLYDIVMGIEGGLISDRNKVSSQAGGVWQYYKDKRKDVTHKLLDDREDPKTKPKIDDASSLYPDGEDNPLNYAYFQKEMPETKKLLSNNALAVKKLSSILHVGIDEVEDFISNATHDFFENRYTRN